MEAGIDNLDFVANMTGPTQNFMPHADVILTESIPSLGAEADLVKVRRGYARNFLLPRKKAVEATSASAKLINHLKAKRAEREAMEITASEELARKISKLELSFELETGQAGKAFGSVTSKDITDKLASMLPGTEIPRHAVVLDRPIKESGSHEVSVKLHAEVVASVRVNISAPTAPSAEEDAQERPVRKRRTAEPAPSEPLAEE